MMSEIQQAVQAIFDAETAPNASGNSPSINEAWALARLLVDKCSETCLFEGAHRVGFLGADGRVYVADDGGLRVADMATFELPWQGAADGAWHDSDLLLTGSLRSVGADDWYDAYRTARPLGELIRTIILAVLAAAE